MALTQISDAGLKTPASDLQDDEKIILGTGNDLEIYHDGNSYIDNTNDSCDLRIQSDTIELKASSADEVILKGVKDGAVELYHNAVKKFETTSSGSKTYGELHILDGSESTNKLTIGDNDDFDIWHETAGTFIRNHEGYLAIQNADDNINTIFIRGRAGENGIKVIGDGAVELYHDDTKRFETVSDGIRWTGHCYANDNYKLRLGTGEDLQLYHDATNSWIDNTTGNLLIRDNTGDIYLQAPVVSLQGGTSESNKQTAKFTAGGSVELYHNDTKRFETTSEGIKISGDTWINSTAFDPDNGAFDPANYPLVVQNPEDTNADSTGIGFAVTTATDKVGAAIHHVREGGGSQGDMRFLTSSDGNSITERMRIASNGYTYIGTTSTAPNPGFWFNPAGQQGIGNNDGTANQSFIEFRRNTTQIGSVTQNGTTGVNFNTSSDYRLKENQVAISDGITRLKTLKPYRFNWKAEPSITVDGFFAHEVTAVPEAIVGTKDKVDEDDKPIYQQIDQSKLVPLLTAALQEAITKIETLETKVAALEAA